MPATFRIIQRIIADRFDIVCGQLSNATVASGIGVSRESIRRYRLGTAPIPASIAAMICEQYKVSPGWLILGKGPVPRAGTRSSSRGAAKPGRKSKKKAKRRR